tara:strand:+ start:3211 stop:3984 length:774 start_codon:yes stop_codon:yes gene_type:complete
MKFNLSKHNLQFISDNDKWKDQKLLGDRTDEFGFECAIKFSPEDIFELKSKLNEISQNVPSNFKSRSPGWQIYDAKACELIHSILRELPIKIAISAGFWRYLSCCCYEYVFKRYGYNSNEDFNDDHFGLIREAILPRLWFRADSIFEKASIETEEVNPYELAKLGSSDFWSSFILRRDFARSRSLNRAMVKYFFIPNKINWILKDIPISVTESFRTLGKEIQKQHSITPYEILSEKDCLKLISELASEINLIKHLEN